MCLNLGCTVLETELARALASKGYRFTVTRSAELLPAERLTIYVNCNPCVASGLPEDVAPVRPTEVLNAVREVMNRLAVQEVDPALLASCKTLLTGRLGAQSADPRWLRDQIIYRSALGRDLTGGYKERIKAVSAAEIREMFEALSDCQCEYIVQ